MSSCFDLLPISSHPVWSPHNLMSSCFDLLPISSHPVLISSQFHLILLGSPRNLMSFSRLIPSCINKFSLYLNLFWSSPNFILSCFNLLPLDFILFWSSPNFISSCFDLLPNTYHPVLISSQSDVILLWSPLTRCHPALVSSCLIPSCNDLLPISSQSRMRWNWEKIITGWDKTGGDQNRMRWNWEKIKTGWNQVGGDWSRIRWNWEKIKINWDKVRIRSEERRVGKECA